MRRGMSRRLATAAILLSTGLVAIPYGAATALTTGEGFDTCQAMPTSAMRSLTGGSYRTAGIYIGGQNRSCTQPELTNSWVRTVAAAGWTLIPTYVGAQAPCTNASSVVMMSSDPATAHALGMSEADDASTEMANLGLGPPNIAYNDMEAYSASDTSCAASVAAYLDGWIAELHHDGYRAGVYGSTASTIAQLVAAYNNLARQRPDGIWIARYDQVDSTHDAAVPDTEWVGHRLRQYDNTATLNPPSGDPSSVGADLDAIGGDTAVPTAENLPLYAVSGTASIGFVKERSTPSTSGADMAHDNEGTALTITCQITGDSVAGDPVWDKLNDNNYVSDLYTTTPAGLSWAGTLPRCDNTHTARITTPYRDAQVLFGSTFTVQVDVPDVTATSVDVAASTNGGSSWTTVGATSTESAGDFAVSVHANWPIGSTVLLRADVSGSGTTWPAVNQPQVHVRAPTVTLATMSSATTAPVATFHWTGADGAARVPSYDVRYEHAAWNSGFGAWTSPSGWTGTTSTSKALSLAEGYDYCVEVRAHGVLGDIGPWSAPRCIARVLDDRAMVASTGWSRGTANGYYDRTWSSTKLVGKTLTRTGASVDRIGILATTCAACGKVGVYIGGRLVGTISLVANRTHLQQLLTVKAFSLRAGTVVLKSLTSGALVQIDGLLLSRT